jgi:hypothetical protein
MTVYFQAIAGGAEWSSLYVEGAGPDQGKVKWTAFSGASGGTAATAGTVTAGAWHHVCGVEFAANDRRVYLDGTPAGTNTDVKTPGVPVEQGIGAFIDGLTLLYEGDIAHVSLWDAALTDDEVNALSAGVSPLRLDRGNLVAYWPLNGQYPETDVTAGDNRMAIPLGADIAEERTRLFGNHIVAPTPAPPLFPQNNADFQAIMPNAGVASELFLMDEASGNLVGVINGTVLNPAGAPTYQQPTIWPNKDGVVFVDGSADLFQAAGGAGVFDAALGSLAMMVILNVSVSTGSRRILTKYNQATSEGYRLLIGAAGNLNWQIGDGLVIDSAFVADDHEGLLWAVLLTTVDRNIPQVGLYTPLNTNEAPITAGSITSTSVFKISLGGAGPSMNVAAIGIWEGTEAEGMNNTDRLAMSQYLGLEQ